MFAAFTIASTSSRVMSPWIARIIIEFNLPDGNGHRLGYYTATYAPGGEK